MLTICLTVSWSENIIARSLTLRITFSVQGSKSPVVVSNWTVTGKSLMTTSFITFSPIVYHLNVQQVVINQAGLFQRSERKFVRRYALHQSSRILLFLR